MHKKFIIIFLWKQCRFSASSPLEEPEFDSVCHDVFFCTIIICISTTYEPVNQSSVLHLEPSGQAQEDLSNIAQMIPRRHTYNTILNIQEGNILKHNITMLLYENLKPPKRHIFRNKNKQKNGQIFPLSVQFLRVNNWCMHTDILILFRILLYLPPMSLAHVNAISALQ